MQSIVAILVLTVFLPCRGVQDAMSNLPGEPQDDNFLNNLVARALKSSSLPQSSDFDRATLSKSGRAKVPSKNSVLMLSQADLESIGMTFADSIECCEKSFTAHGNKAYEMPPKPGVHALTDSFIHAMPCYLAQPKSCEDAPCGIKWIAGYSSNPKNKLPMISGVMFLNDYKTGFVKAAMDGAFVTNIRTAGATCASYKKFCKPTDSVVGLAGAGMQGKWNIVALSSLMTIKKLKVFDVVPAALEACKKLVEEKIPGCEVVFCDKEKDACTDVDVLLTATGAQAEPVFFTEWVKPGCTIFPIMARGWNRDALKKCDKFICDDWEQFKMLTHGWYEEPAAPYAETGEVLCGKKAGREGNETIICINTGLGLHDLVTADALLKKREKLGMTCGSVFSMTKPGPPSAWMPDLK
eukprot:gnl/TRDRNA2_/TRDRNA2_176633_c1_seq11.p1 gnl/TRDRNA2_/TRDRNA2_176633_c1~~gnl/TRDRNA2_/TRDRNA2_176633_c1_seq11.p1  ORF type:complete len:410 (-),score=99.26 gnl/TRDRNA2_/TRDRNA2_176633_c1_seq11:363-1592(-)